MPLQQRLTAQLIAFTSTKHASKKSTAVTLLYSTTAPTRVNVRLSSSMWVTIVWPALPMRPLWSRPANANLASSEYLENAYPAAPTPSSTAPPASASATSLATASNAQKAAHRHPTSRNPSPPKAPTKEEQSSSTDLILHLIT